MERTVADINAEIEVEIATYQENAAKALDGNKAAAARARKASNTLTKLFKEFRKASVAQIG